MSTLPLNVSQEGEWTVIEARPSPMPKRGPILALLVPAFFCGVLIANGAAKVGLILWLIVSGLIFAWLSYTDRRKRHGKLGPFAVKHDALRLPNGTVIPRGRLYRLGIRNTEDGQVFFYGGSGVQRMGQAGAALTHQRMLKISNAVVAEHDGTLSYLAGGLTPELANATLHEVTRRLDGFS